LWVLRRQLAPVAARPGEILAAGAKGAHPASVGVHAGAFYALFSLACSAVPAQMRPRCLVPAQRHGATVQLNGAHVLASMCVHAHTPVATAQAQRWTPA
jgi:hypothetical protein